MTITFGWRPANGTEGAYQRAQTCAQCTVDHDGGWHDDSGDGDSCPIIMAAMFGEHSYGTDSPGPPEWGHDLDTGVWVCTAFAGPCSCERHNRS
jgi:hypothetical protein